MMTKEVYRLAISNSRFVYKSASPKDVWLETNYVYLVDLIKSVLKVARRYYYHYDAPHYERAFAYELYHQWSKFLEGYQKAGNPNICLNAEVKKFLDGHKKLPDMVLHEDGQNNQEIVVEIKRMPSAKESTVVEDLKKIEQFLTDSVGLGDKAESFMQGFSPYKYGIFIATCGTIDDMANLLGKKFGTLARIVRRLRAAGKAGHLYCFCCVGSGILQYTTLEMLVQYIKSRQQ